MIRTILVNAVFLLSFAALSAGCSRAEVVCELICECEHCSDVDEIETCAELVRQEEVADAYDCGDAWSTYTLCIEEQGTCDETEANYSTVDSSTHTDRCRDEYDAVTACNHAASSKDTGF